MNAANNADRLGTNLAAYLSELLKDIPIGEKFYVPPSADICYCMELYLPMVLRGRYPEWAKESLDGSFVARAKKTGPLIAQFDGTCILISDQTVTPFSVEIGAVSQNGPMNLLRLKLGEPGAGPLGISGPPSDSRGAKRLLETLLNRIDKVEWTYTLEMRSEMRESLNSE